MISGGWSGWGSGSACSAECTSTKTRTCTNPAPYNYKNCEGAATLSSSCTGGSCNPVSTSGEVKSPNYPNDYPSIV